MKILYAASNNHNARIQLSRFLGQIYSGHVIKIAAYKSSSPKGLSIDWTLDALLNIYRPDLLSVDNDNLEVYFEQIKSFAPDLIISDLEYFTSYIANELNITLWQYSCSLINFALTKREKYNLGLFKHHAHSLNRDPVHTQRIVNMIDNSNCNLVCSHFGDTANPPNLQENFTWIRPYHKIAKKSVPCQHNVIAGLSSPDNKLISVLKKYPDSVVFMESPTQKHSNVQVKDIGMQDEYYCNLGNSSTFVCQGQASFLADAFYNKKAALIYPDYTNTESIINSQLSAHLQLGHIMTYEMDISAAPLLEISPAQSSAIGYLHNKL